MLIEIWSSGLLRQTYVVDSPKIRIQNAQIFPDFSFGGVRYYFKLNYVSDTKIKITDATAGSGGSISYLSIQFFGR